MMRLLYKPLRFSPTLASHAERSVRNVIEFILAQTVRKEIMSAYSSRGAPLQDRRVLSLQWKG